MEERVRMSPIDLVEKDGRPRGKVHVMIPTTEELPSALIVCDTKNAVCSTLYQETGPDQVSRVLKDERGFFAVGSTDLALVPGSNYLHGFEVIAPLVYFGEQLLNPDEEILGIQNIKFLQPVTTNLELLASIAPFETDGLTVAAELNTSQGRKIYVYGRGNGNPLDMRINTITKPCYSTLLSRHSFTGPGWPRLFLGKLFFTPGKDCSECGSIEECREERPREKDLVDSAERNQYTAFLRGFSGVLSQIAKFLDENDPTGRRNKVLIIELNGISLSLCKAANEGEVITLSVDPENIRKSRTGLDLIPIEFEVAGSRGSAKIGYTSDPEVLARLNEKTKGRNIIPAMSRKEAGKIRG